MIKDQLTDIRQHLPENAQLVAVSKFHPLQTLQEAYDAGQRIFGESRVQELLPKHEAMPDDVEWHFIGSLQTNKVKYIAPFVALIHSVDSFRLLEEIDRQGQRCGRTIDILLEVHVAQETSKHGFLPSELLAMLEEGRWKSLQHVRIRGLMTMASFTEDEKQIDKEFATIAQLFQDIKRKYFAEADYFNLRSWGMSDDYPIALRHEANLVRIGTAIFGARA